MVVVGFDLEVVVVMVGFDLVVVVVVVVGWMVGVRMKSPARRNRRHVDVRRRLNGDRLLNDLQNCMRTCAGGGVLVLGWICFVG